MRRGALAVVVNVLFISSIVASPRSASADVFDDLGGFAAKVSGLRGAIRELANGAAEGIRAQLNAFVDEKIDPLLSRVDNILAARTDQAAAKAITVLQVAEAEMSKLLDLAAKHIESLSAQFFIDLNKSVDHAFEQMENIVDEVLCKVAPGGRVHISLGPFGGDNQIRVRRPLRTYCYSQALGAKGDPFSAVFEGWDYYYGELCEYELKLDRINPMEQGSTSDIIRACDKLAEMADAARCAAPDDSAKVLMAKKLYKYRSCADFYRGLQTGDTHR